MRGSRSLSATVARAVTWEPSCYGGSPEPRTAGTSRLGGEGLPQGALRLDRQQVGWRSGECGCEDLAEALAGPWGGCPGGSGVGPRGLSCSPLLRTPCRPLPLRGRSVAAAHSRSRSSCRCTARWKAPRSIGFCMCSPVPVQAAAIARRAGRWGRPVVEARPRTGRAG